MGLFSGDISDQLLNTINNQTPSTLAAPTPNANVPDYPPELYGVPGEENAVYQPRFHSDFLNADVGGPPPSVVSANAQRAQDATTGLFGMGKPLDKLLGKTATDPRGPLDKLLGKEQSKSLASDENGGAGSTNFQSMNTKIGADLANRLSTGQGKLAASSQAIAAEQDDKTFNLLFGHNNSNSSAPPIEPNKNFNIAIPQMNPMTIGSVPPVMSDQNNKMNIQKSHKQTQDFLNSIYKRGR